MDESYLHVNHKSECSWFGIDGDHRSMNRKGRGQRVIVVHTINKQGPVIDTTGVRVGERKDLPWQKGGLHRRMEIVVLGGEGVARRVRELEAGRT